MQTRYDARARIRSAGQEVNLDRGASSNDSLLGAAQFSSSQVNKQHGGLDQHRDQSEYDPNSMALLRQPTDIYVLFSQSISSDLLHHDKFAVNTSIPFAR